MTNVQQSAHILDAKKYIQVFEHVKRPNEEQRAILAAAYYTLSNQENISDNKSRMNINAAIALLKGIPIESRKDSWATQIAHAYFKRAELLEDKQSFTNAIQDYHLSFESLENSDLTNLDNDARLLIAKASISIADLICNEPIELKAELFANPRYYIDKALQQLSLLTGNISQENKHDIEATYAYAHQIAGMALGVEDFESAKETFKRSLAHAYKTETPEICPLLSDIYSCLGILYEQYYDLYPLRLNGDISLEHAMLYYKIACLFTDSIEENAFFEDFDIEDESVQTLESLFEIIYRVLDPYLPPLSLRVTCDLIDALIYAYLCIVDQALPNKILEDELSHPEALDVYTQHIYWLVLEAYLKAHPRTSTYEMLNFDEVECELSKGDILLALQNPNRDNVHYLSNH